MTTRLDRLIVLLENGSNPSVRAAAAEQLGAMQAQRADQMFHLISRVLPLLQSKSWETRSAGALALEKIAANFKAWIPLYGSDTSIKEELEDENLDEGDDEDWWSFQTVDLANVIENGRPLTSSSGDEFNVDFTGMNSHERLVLMQKQIKEKLGFEGFMNMDFVSQQDLESEAVSDSILKKRKAEEQVSELVAKAKKRGVGEHNLSTREKAMKKRQQRLAKKEARSGTLEVKPDDLSTMVVSYKGNSHSELLNQLEEEYQASNIEGASGQAATQWPFERICTLLKLHLFDSRWETRHGACLGLLAILKRHSKGAGQVSGLSKTECERRHRRWIEDEAVRLLCLLALDKFSDFLSDSMVCPVREAAAQVLAVIASNAEVQIASDIVTLGLAKLLNCTSTWEVEYSGLLGLKYWIAVRSDLVSGVIVSDASGNLWHTLGKSLASTNDEIRSMTASALGAMLVPLSKHFKESELVEQLVLPLWDLLLELDDLCSATEPVLQLLAQCFSLEKLTDLLSQQRKLDSGDIYDRFYPFFRHYSRSVRLSVLECVSVLSRFSVNFPGTLLRLLFQNFILDDDVDVQLATARVWELLVDILASNSTNGDFPTHFISACFLLVVTPLGNKLDPQLFVLKTKVNDWRLVETVYTRDSAIIKGDLSIFDAEQLYQGRLHAARALGKFLQVATRVASPEELTTTRQLVLAYLASGLLAHRVFCAFIIASWAKNGPTGDLRQTWKAKLEDMVGLESNTTLIGTSCFTDFAPILLRLRHAVEAVYLQLKAKGIRLHTLEPTGEFTFHTANAWISQYFPHYDSSVDVTATKVIFDKEWQLALQLVNRASAAVSRALLSFDELPVKLTPIIKPLTSSIRSDTKFALQRASCDSLNTLIEMLFAAEKVAPVSKIVKNIVSLVQLLPSNYFALLDVDFGLSKLEGKDSIWSFSFADEELSNCLCSPGSFEKIHGLISNKAVGAVTGGGSVDDIVTNSATKKNCKVQQVSTWVIDNGATLEPHLIALRGACEFLRALKRKELLADLWDELVVKPLESTDSLRDVSAACVLAAHLGNYSPVPTAVIELLLQRLRSKGMLERHMASLALARLVAQRLRGDKKIDLMLTVLEYLLEALDGNSILEKRQGGAEFLGLLVDELDFALLPWLVFFIVPVLERMSDSDLAVRYVCSNSFAILVKWMPLEAGAPEIENLPEAWVKHKLKERSFVNQLIGGSDSVENFEIPVEVNVKLRPYQVEGVNWLAFLRKYGLHGILCDDMGLGKTLQTIVIVSSDHFLDSAPGKKSLIVCPPTLIGHWCEEMKTYVNNLKPVVYQGPEKNELLSSEDYNVVVASYHSVSRDSAILSQFQWNYVVLDEGHVIKNPKTKLSIAVKALPSRRRLILSGTPIQNNVLEMWSLFDFLMPGFLGTSLQFNDRYGKPILNSRDAKADSKEQEQGALALEALHKQVLPFLLRRMKEDVLDDLPPKIIQDYLCDLSPLQKQLYKEFLPQDSQADEIKKDHVFQSLQYLRKLCSHPALVLTPKHPQYQSISQDLARQNSSLHDIKHAPKLLALREILVSCGIGSSDDGDEVAPIAANNRVLIFAQFRATLDTIEQDLFKGHMPGVTFMRLDGAVEASKRHQIVQEFNCNPSIDVLLLTTSVGGLGLNLTGADTVVFMEHDWNPMKDLQAMDRAHRLGQKRLVNVYRLITRGTLEEKIMTLQKFKVFTANSIINQDNQGLLSMQTDKILDLFQLEDGQAQSGTTEDVSGEEKKLTTKQILQQLEMNGTWEEEYQDLSLDSFLAKLK